MKKFFIFLVGCVLSMTACADDHHLIKYSELPVQAQTFVQKYFNLEDISHIERDREGMHYEYNVYLRNTTEIEFDYQGNLQAIDCKYIAVPKGIVPEVIMSFVSLHYPNLYVVEYVIDYRYQTVELNNEMELIFDREGRFLRMDD